MKKLLFLVMLVSTSVSANYMKTCSQKAEEICAELDGAEFRKCYNGMMQSCLDDLLSDGKKSNPICLEECYLVADEAARDLCIETCLEY